MNELLTPKQVARAIQVSEASIKRWCDKGVIPTQYTVGGHRRIPMDGLMDFLRASNRTLVRPEVLGLPATAGQTTRVIERAADQLTQALIQGDEELCLRIALDLHLAGHGLSAICDQVFAVAFEAIGRQWECGDVEVYQERYGCEITLHVLHELRSLVTAPMNGPLAIGGAVEGDQYNLATTMAEIVLRSAGWNASSLGDNLPFPTLAAAIGQLRPRLFWLSCSHLSDVEAFLAGYNTLYDQYGQETAFVVGGRALTDELRRQMKYAAFCDNMQHLESFARTIYGPAQRRSVEEGVEPR
jgi:excisionase family DNA binding protein